MTSDLTSRAGGVDWKWDVEPHADGGFVWSLWTRHELWLPLHVQGRIDTRDDAEFVVRRLAYRCTKAVEVLVQQLGSRGVKMAMMTVFPDEPAGGGSAVGHLSVGQDSNAEDDRWRPLEVRAVDWQTRGGRQKFVGLQTSPDTLGWRLPELFGCMGALGEQVTLACAAARDLDLAVASPDSPHAELLRRAWAEHVMHWSMAAGHMLLNVAARAIALDATVHPHLLERQDATSAEARRKALRTDFPPESDLHRDWPPLNKTRANYLRRAAAESGVPEVGALGELVHGLAVDRRWVAMTSLRGEAFHRWRAQTAGVSTMHRRATRVVGDNGLLPGGRVPDVRGPEGSARAVTCAQDALKLLGATLEEFDDLLPGVLASLTSAVIHSDGLLSTHGPMALVESSRGTGAMIIPVQADRVENFLRKISGNHSEDPIA